MLLSIRRNHPPKRSARILIFLAVVMALGFLGIPSARASSSQVDSFQENQVTPAQLIEAVNNLRVSYGLNPLIIHSILMQTAQQQANALMASGGAVGHSRPGGISYTDQLIMLGYPLAGDLSLGGYRAENWLSAYPGMTVEQAIEMWMGDAPHTNTMLSPYYQDIGAGVAYGSDGVGYLVIDCAMPTASGLPQAYTPEAPRGVGTPEGLDMNQVIQPVILVTARPDGDVVHVVENGQSLWSIAIAYGTKIDEIRRLNNITDLTIYVGEKLLVLKGATQPPPEPTETAAATPRPSRTPFPATSTATPEPGGENDSAQAPAPTRLTPMGFMAAFLVLSAVIGGVITWLTTRKEGEV